MHLWDVPFPVHPKIRLGAWLLQFFFLTGNSCTKISILFVYRRISLGSSSRWFVRLTWAAIAFSIIYTIALMLELFFICHPYDSYWKAYDITYAHKYKCGNERVPIILSVCLNFVSDIYATVLPMFLVQKLKLSRKQRIGLALLFSVGILTIGTGAARIYYINTVTIGYKPGPNTRDITWYGWPLYVWTDIEAHLAIICASAPALKVVFKKKLKDPLILVYVSSRQQLSRYQSLRSKSSASRRSHADSDASKPSTTENGARRLHNLVRHSNQHFEIVHVHPRHISAHMATVEDQHKRDIEKFPMERIINVEKSLPDSPAPSWPMPPDRDGRTVYVETVREMEPGRRSGEEGEGDGYETSGEYLPIYVASGVPPIMRRI